MGFKLDRFSIVCLLCCFYHQQLRFSNYLSKMVFVEKFSREFSAGGKEELKKEIAIITLPI